MKVLLGFLFFCPIFYDPHMFIPSMGLRANQEQFFQIGATVLFAFVTLENSYLAFFYLWSVAIYCFYGFPQIGGPIVMNIFFGCIIYQIAYKLIKKDNVEKVFKMLLWLCVANIVWLILQMNKSDLIFLREDAYTVDLVGLMGLKCFMGMFFALCIPILAYFSWPLALSFFLPIYYSQSSVAVVGGIAGFLFVLYYKSKKMFVVFLLIFIVEGGLFVARDTKKGMFEDRFRMWKVVLRDAFKHPIMGWGLDSFRSVGEFKPFMYVENAMTLETRRVHYKALEIAKETHVLPPGKEYEGFVSPGDALNPWDNPHNEYIMLFYEFGIIGIMIFLAFAKNIKAIFITTPQIIAIMGVFIVFLIISTGQFPFHVVRLGYLAPVMLGAYYKLIKDQKEQEIQTGDVIYGS